MAKILIVDDDQQILDVVAEALLQENYVVETTLSGEDALERMLISRFDVVVLDLNLPDLSGFDVCKLFRDKGLSTPIIMLTGKTGVEDRVSGLDCGADDYVVKPFHVVELMARIRALLRRPEAALSSNVVRVGDLVVDIDRRTAKKGDIDLHLLPKEFQLLELFIRNPDRLFSTEELLMRVWESDSEVGAYAVRSSIKRLRQAIDDDSKADSLIENLPKLGYKLRSK